jgi:uncharacterized membrane protein YidH (DUF202 family)
MKPKMVVAALLIGLGIAAFAYQANRYMTGRREMSIGGLPITTERTHSVPLTPIVGVIALIVGIAMLLVDKGDLKRSDPVG